MRKLWPTNENESALYPKSKSFTEEQYNDLLEKISTLADDVENSKIDFNTFKEDLSNQITTFIFNTTRATIDEATIKALVAESFSSNTIISESIQSDTLTINEDALIERLNSTFARITDLVANNIQSDSIESNNIITNTIKANTAEIDEYDITNLVSDDATISNATIQEATIENESVHNLISNDATIDDLKVNTIKATNANITTADVDKLEYEFIYNDDDAFQDIVEADGIVYIILPKFENGVYYLAGIDTSNNDKLFTIELFNSIQNRFLRWSDSDAKYLIEAYNVDNFTIKINTRGKAIRVYHRADSLSTKEPPTIVSNYIEPSEGDISYYKIVYKDGNKIWKPFDLFNQGSAVGVLTLDQSTDFESTTDQDPTNYDTSDDTTRTYYIPNQDVNKEASVTFKNIEIDNRIKNKNIYVGNENEYDSSYMNDGALVILEEVITKEPTLEPPSMP